MSGSEGFARALSKMVKGTRFGSFKGAQPVVQSRPVGLRGPQSAPSQPCLALGVSDAFARGDGNLGADYSVTSQFPAGTDVIQVVSGTAKLVQPYGGGAIHAHHFETNDMEASITVVSYAEWPTSVSGDQFQIALRANDSTSGLLLIVQTRAGFDTNSPPIWQILQGNTDHFSGNGADITDGGIDGTEILAPGDVIAFRVCGSVVTASLNGLVQATATTSFDLSDDAGHRQAGFAMWQLDNGMGIVDNVAIDDFQAENFCFGDC